MAIISAIFTGNLAWRTSEEDLQKIFGRYGLMLEATILRDKQSGRFKGFGFVHHIKMKPLKLSPFSTRKELMEEFGRLRKQPRKQKDSTRGGR